MTPIGRLPLEMLILPGNEPFEGKFTDMAMLVMFTGRERTEVEYGALVVAAGFRVTRVIPTQSDVA
jgi:hypothetical protein